MKHDAWSAMNDSKTAVGTRVVLLVMVVVVVVVVVVLGAARILAAHKPWTGLSSATPPKVIGAYATAEACRVEVGKVGGWCGKGCRDYGTEQATNFAPLISVERVQ
jgi:hypothetical protein